jgi:glycosyltransferase involved in cell wall biosynthesis
MMKAIVSVTPLAVEADSRTYKEAASFTRLGYRSIVVEGRRSGLPREALPFELHTLEKDLSGPADASDDTLSRSAARADGSSLHRIGLQLPRAIQEPYRAAGWITAVFRELRGSRRLPPASLYVLHGSKQFPAVYMACRRQGVPFVYDAHDFYSVLVAEQRFEPRYARSVAFLRDLLERRCVRAAAACVTVAPTLARLQQQHFGRSFAVVRNAHDPRLDEETPVSVREAAGSPTDAFLVTVIGNAKPSIDFATTLDAIARLPANVHLACVGRGYDRYQQAVASSGIAERVHFVGAVPPVQVASFVRDADLAAVLYTPNNVSVLNALPNGFFQAVAAGLPMVYARLPEIEAVARDHGLGVPVNPGDPAGIAAAVESLLCDRERLAGYRAHADRASRTLTWEREERKLAEVVEAAMGAAP